jgi:hypothetical protein
MFSKTDRPSSDGGGDGGEVVVGEDHRRGLAGDVGARFAHRDAEVGLLERRRVIHAIARHRDDVASALERLHQPQLLLRRDAREHRHLVRERGQCGVVDPVELLPGDCDEPVGRVTLSVDAQA